MSLIGGGSSNEGNVYIDDAPLCHRYKSWNWNDGEVVCRDLGYNYTLRITKDSYFGGVPDWFLYERSNIGCNGQENSVSECNSYKGIQHPCNNNTGVGVICSNTPPSRHLVF